MFLADSSSEATLNTRLEGDRSTRSAATWHAAVLPEEGSPLMTSRQFVLVDGELCAVVLSDAGEGRWDPAD